MSLDTILKSLERLEALAGPADLEALTLMLNERLRQVEVEQWAPSFDDTERQHGQLAAAAASYALSVRQKAVLHVQTGALDVRPSAPHPSWPFPITTWRPASMRRMAQKSGALIWAELAREIRAGIP